MSNLKLILITEAIAMFILAIQHFYCFIFDQTFPIIVYPKTFVIILILTLIILYIVRPISIWFNNSKPKEMSKITNTENNTRVEWLMGGNPNAIEVQEAQGQIELINSSQLPVKLNFPRKTDVISQYESIGIKVIRKTEDDYLFFDVELPKGWKKEMAVDDSMWSYLIDAKGRERANIFYKAAFYDRDAFINFNARYVCCNEYHDNNSRTAVVKDNATGKILFETEKYNYASKNPEKYREQAEKFLKSKYPDADNINAYWD